MTTGRHPRPEWASTSPHAYDNAQLEARYQSKYQCPYPVRAKPIIRVRGTRRADGRPLGGSHYE